MSTKHFTIKTIFQTAIYTAITIIALSILHNPIIANNIALMQLENNDGLYILMEAYNKSKHYISIIHSLVTVWYVTTTIYDIYKLTKTKE